MKILATVITLSLILASTCLAGNVIVFGVQLPPQSEVAYIQSSEKIDTQSAVIRLPIPAKINDITFTKSITLRENGTVEVGHLASNQEIQGIFLKGSVNGAEMPVLFHPNGYVKSGVLARETTINGYIFKNFVELFDNGQISSGTLAINTNVQGHRFLANTRLTFNEGGVLTSR